MDQEYWNNRAVQLSESLLNIGDEAYARLAQEYDRAMFRIEKEIEAFYGRFATENKISFSDAKRILTSSERKAFQMDLQEYIKKGETLNYSKEWSAVLENASSVARVNRLQSLQVQMAQQVEELHVKYNTNVTEMAQKVLKDGYYKNIFEIQKAEGIGGFFARLDTEQVKTIINTPWAPDGSNFSQRIWKNRTELVNYLNTELTQAFIRGERADRLIKELKKKFGVSSRDAARLVQTETAFFATRAKIESYKALGYAKYVVVAVMDGKTSQVCRELDAEVFDIEDFAPGRTAPPFHPRCRSTIAPYASVGKKDAKGQLMDDKTGEMYSVPEDMTYKEWTEKYVEEKPENVIIELSESEKKAINRYIGSESHILNEKLRHGEPLSDDEQSWIGDLTQALSKMPDYKGNAVRCLNISGDKALEEFLAEYSEESEIITKSFMSFSKVNNYNETANIKLYVVSKKGKDISRINEAEQEVIYPAGSGFNVLNVVFQDNIYYILLEEIL